LIELFDVSAIAAIVTDQRFVVAVVVTAISGLVRGFSGFGSGMIYVPLISAVYEPRIAVATLLLIEIVSVTPFAVQAFQHCNWRDVLPVWIAAAVATPFGVMVLLVADPVALRWGISVLALAFLVVIASGWRYQGRPTLPVKIGVGMISGLTGGAVQISGPPVILYWLGRSSSNSTAVRANLMVFLAMNALSGFVAYAGQGLLTSKAIVLSVLLGLPFILAMVVGARFFWNASEQLYRRMAYAIVAASAIISLPVLDLLFRS
jgi:uncharacterized membrane protein YfcA